MIRINVYIPKTHLELVKAAMFEAGAGKIGCYEACAWQTKGEGQFRPISGALPFIGSEGELETVEEYKVEMVCEDDKLKGVMRAMKDAHPYEEPAYDVYKPLDSSTWEDL